jgi:hypothetical protein
MRTRLNTLAGLSSHRLVPTPPRHNGLTNQVYRIWLKRQIGTTAFRGKWLRRSPYPARTQDWLQMAVAGWSPAAPGTAVMMGPPSPRGRSVMAFAAMPAAISSVVPAQGRRRGRGTGGSRVVRSVVVIGTPGCDSASAQQDKRDQQNRRLHPSPLPSPGGSVIPLGFPMDLPEVLFRDISS